MQDSPSYRLFHVEHLAGDVVELPPAEAHHALGVLRLRDGEGVELFDGRGGWATGAIQRTGKNAATVSITSRTVLTQRPWPHVELAFAVPKGKRLDWLLEKATELGVGRLCPVIFERSVATPELSEHARARWMGTCLAAAKQCRAAFLPELAEPVEFSAYRAACPAEDRLLGDPAAAQGMSQALASWSPPRRIALLVGPEGGLTPGETAAAIEATWRPVRLGNYILRTETAALALLAGVNACCSSPSPKGEGENKPSPGPSDRPLP